LAFLVEGILKIHWVVSVAVCLCTSPAVAQQNLVGKYTGSFMVRERGAEVPVGFTLEISSVDDRKVKAVAVRSGGAGTATRQCAGNYELEGTLSGNDLRLRSTSGPKADCTMSLRLVAEGDKLKGQIGSQPIELSK